MIANYGETHIMIDSETTACLRPPEQAGERAIQIRDRGQRVALYFASVELLDKFVEELAALRVPMAKAAGIDGMDPAA